MLLMMKAKLLKVFLAVSLIVILMPALNVSAISTIGTAYVTSNQAVIYWGADPNEHTFQVYRNGTQVGTTSSTSYSFTGLSACTTYTFGVYSNMYDYKSIQVQTTCSVSVPAAPSSLSLSSSAITISSSWPASSGATGYRVYLNGSLRGSTSSTSFSIGNLIPSTNYSVCVEAYNSAGTSPQQRCSSIATKTAQYWTKSMSGNIHLEGYYNAYYSGTTANLTIYLYRVTSSGDVLVSTNYESVTPGNGFFKKKLLASNQPSATYRAVVVSNTTSSGQIAGGVSGSLVN